MLALTMQTAAVSCLISMLSGKCRQEMSEVKMHADSQRLQLIKTQEALDTQEQQMAQVLPCPTTQ